MATFKQFKAQDIIISPLEVNKGFRFIANTPTPTITPSPSVTPTISATPSISITPSVTVTPTISITPSTTPSISITRTPSVTPSITITPSISLSGPPNQSVTPSPSKSITPSISITRTPSVTPTRSITPSPSSNLYSYTNYGYAGSSCDDACIDYVTLPAGGNPAIYTNIPWTAGSTPIIYFNSGGTKRAVSGYYVKNNICGYYGSSGTWSGQELCTL